MEKKISCSTVGASPYHLLVCGCSECLSNHFLSCSYAACSLFADSAKWSAAPGLFAISAFVVVGSASAGSLPSLIDWLVTEASNNSPPAVASCCRRCQRWEGCVEGSLGEGHLRFQQQGQRLCGPCMNLILLLQDFVERCQWGFGNCSLFLS